MSRSTSAVPEADLECLRAWCGTHVPLTVRQGTVSFEVSSSVVTVVEHGPPRPGLADPTVRVIAQLRRGPDGFWSLYWADRDEHWHPYRPLPDSRSLVDLLAEVDRDPLTVFWH